MNELDLTLAISAKRTSTHPREDFALEASNWLGLSTI